MADQVKINSESDEEKVKVNVEKLQNKKSQANLEKERRESMSKVYKDIKRLNPWLRNKKASRRDIIKYTAELILTLQDRLDKHHPGNMKSNSEDIGESPDEEESSDEFEEETDQSDDCEEENLVEDISRNIKINSFSDKDKLENFFPINVANAINPATTMDVEDGGSSYSLNEPELIDDR